MINSRQNAIYSLKIFHFVLYRRSSILQDIHFYIVFADLFLNCLVRVLPTTGDPNAVAGKNACIITRKLKGLDSREITS